MDAGEAAAPRGVGVRGVGVEVGAGEGGDKGEASKVLNSF